ncbi:MAG: Zn-dependent hydrolase [Alphaproteobacteria bacterium]|jgi:N-carbamoyl-L-amino-acid hydrolase|nr:Zn-dependent hydrolase [Alphaproteobacteria bacterium]
MTDKINLLQVDDGRLWETIERSARIGPGRDQGLRRLALEAPDKEMRDLFVAWCEAAGCAVTVDAMGNIFARRPGTDDDLPPVLIGSHLDTQFTGGRFDGILGVLAGLEIVRTLNDREIATRRAIEVVNWSNEEGARFNPPMLASAVFAGLRELDWAHGRTDNDGVTYGEALAEIGYVGEAPMGGREIDAYFELHIEQGPLLEEAGIDVGIVTHGYATRGMRVEIRGETAHTGPTPMDKRRNALVGAAYLIAQVNDIGWKYHGQGGKTTSSQIEIWPNATGILPEYAQVTIDFRHPDGAGVTRMLAEVEAAIESSAEKGNVDIEIAETWRFGDERFDPTCVQHLRDAADSLGIPYQDMQSQAGHDAYNMTHVCPTALLFCPCEDGITHNEAENVARENAAPSVNVLLHAVLARADR